MIEHWVVKRAGLLQPGDVFMMPRVYEKREEVKVPGRRACLKWVKHTKYVRCVVSQPVYNPTKRACYAKFHFLEADSPLSGQRFQGTYSGKLLTINQLVWVLKCRRQSMKKESLRALLKALLKANGEDGISDYIINGTVNILSGSKGRVLKLSVPPNRHR